MAITIVNGYMCTSSCDAAKARTGQDPHPQDPSNPTAKTQPGGQQSPAVTYGGSLTGKNAVASVSSTAQSAGTSARAPTIDIQA